MFDPNAALRLYKVVKPRAVLIIPQPVVLRIATGLSGIVPAPLLNQMIAQMVPEAVFGVRYPFWWRNPSLFVPGATNLVLALDIEEFTIEAAINDIPTATVKLNVGMVFSQHFSEISSGVFNRKGALAHYLEKFFSDPVAGLNADLRVAIYAHYPSVAFSPDYPELPIDIEDTLTPLGTFSSEWVCLFDGFITGSSDVVYLGNNEQVYLSLTLTHFLTELNFSSALTSTTGPVNQSSMAYNIYTVVRDPSGLGRAEWNSSTLAGYGAFAFSMGRITGADFWGVHYLDTDPETGDIIRSYGLKSFLKALCAQNLFHWYALYLISPESSFCPFNQDDLSTVMNWRAAQALNRIEPITNAIGVFPVFFAYEESPLVQISRDLIEQALFIRSQLRQPIPGLEWPITAVAIDRAELIAAVGPATYFNAGYGYSMPIPLQIIGDQLVPLTQNEGFGYDITFATYSEISKKTIWQLLIQKYFPRYQLTLIPRASYALVAPSHPMMPFAWNILQSKDVFSISRRSSNKVPLRGVIVQSTMTDRESGLFNFGDRRQGRESLLSMLVGVFDSCTPGMFEIKNAPTWILAFNFLPAFAADVVKDQDIANLGNINPFDGHIAQDSAEAANLISPNNIAMRFFRTLNQLARSYYFTEFTKGNFMTVTGKFRYDIAPGSMLLVELPKDKTVEIGFGPAVQHFALGYVAKILMTMSAAKQIATTTFQLTFVRTDQQIWYPNLFLPRHPFWGTLVLGAPWADALWIENFLGPRSSLIG